ncbi:LuxR family transcriptional regulator [Micromonospora purpureochromogenes]|uniref:helix-turn-helix transcriptional regulator n=1 Tax=Micromonospora purpureochromogenes TaxID=47872 RepID=UPI0033F288E7
MGYEGALSLLQGLLRQCDGSSGRLALVEGGLASGKTYLLHQFSRYAVETGALLLSGTASRAEQSVPLGVVDQLFRSADLVDALPERAARLIGSADAGDQDGGWSDPLAEPDARSGWMREFCGVLLGLARERTLVIVIDDLQFADSASLRLLLSLQRRMDAARMLLVLGKWHRRRPTLPLFYTELTRQPHVSIRLSALTVPDIADLLTEKWGKTAPGSVAQEYRDLTNGNPLLVHALLDDNASDAGIEDGATPVVGDGYAHAVLAGLHRWDAQLLDVAAAAAVLNERSDPALIGRLLGMRNETAEEIVGILTEAGVLRDCRMRHPLGATTVLESMTPAERSAVHVRAADLLHQQGAPAAEVGRHLLNAEQVPADWAVGVLRTAADQALAADDPDLAVRCLELGLSGCTDRKERIAIMHALTGALWRRNPSATLAYLPCLQGAVQDGELHGPDAAAVIRYSLWNGDEDAAARAATALGASADPIDAQTAAELAVSFHWFLGPARGRLSEFGPTGTTHPRDLWADAAQRLTSLWGRGGGEAATTSAEHILRSCQIGETPLEVVAAAVLAVQRGNKPELARTWCDRLMRQAAERGEVTWQAVLSSLAGSIAYRRGDLVNAIRHAEQALALLPEKGWGVLIGQPRATLIVARTARGELREAAEVLQAPVPDSMFGTVFSLPYLRARGQFHLATDRVLAAGRDFQLCGRLMREWDVDVPALIPWRSDLAEVNLRLGRSVEARDLLTQQLERARAADVRVRGISLRVLAAASEPAQRPTLLRQSVECLQAADDRLELSKALTAFSVVRQQLGEFDRARVLARRAAQVAQAGTTGPAVPAGGDRPVEPPALVGRWHDREKEGRHVLSEAERRVAKLAALGHTNREISQTLYITVSTVEQHLTRVYRKLGITRRTDLPAEHELRKRLSESRGEGASGLLHAGQDWEELAG